MRVWLPVAVVLLGACLLAPAAHAKGVEAQRGPALDFLAQRLAGSGTLAANIAEAAHANGLDLGSWPSPEASASDAIAVPAEGSANISLLRPLRALALAQDERATVDGELTRRVLATFGPGGYGDQRTLNDDAYAILALAAVGFAADDARIQAARAPLLDQQRDDGGWGWALGAPSGTDLTGLVVAALAASGGIPPDAGGKAAAFLATTRTGAGFAERPGGAPNCESTVWGLRASHRLGLGPRDADWRFLLGLQRPDGGFAHLPGSASDLLCTSEAAALLGETHAGDIPGPVLDGNGVPAAGAVLAAGAISLAAIWVRRV